MKVSGFTFVKDAEKYDFPVVESIKSMLPLCDEVFVNVGVSEDNTLEIVKSIKDNKIKIIETEWDEKFKFKKRILAQQTNIPLYKCHGDWCLYLQADEVLHEKDYADILNCMDRNLDDERVQGILFGYYHFFGSYKTYIRSYHWYMKEIRIIRNHLGIHSWKDAQGFRFDGNKLSVKECPAHVYHYGWVRDPYKMEQKKQYQRSLFYGKVDTSAADKPRHKWRGQEVPLSINPEDTPAFKPGIAEWVDYQPESKERFYYEEGIDPYMIAEFTGDHPGIMKERAGNWKYDMDPKKFQKKLSFKDIRYRVTDFIYYTTGIKIGEYRNYKLIER